jgi:hypothetical protein
MEEFTKFVDNDYTFNASAKKVTLSSIVKLSAILLITNVTAGNATIYEFACPGLGGTISGTVLSLEFDTTEMSDGDELLIILQKKNGENTRLLEDIKSGINDLKNIAEQTREDQNLLLTSMEKTLASTQAEIIKVLKTTPVPFFLESARGRIEGFSSISKFGRNSDIAAGATEDIWDGSALYVFPATALITSMSQTANQAGLVGGTIEWQGLDENWNLITQKVDLDGANTTTVITFPKPFRRIFRGKVLENVVSTSPIRAHNAGETQDYAIIGTGNNQTLMAIYTVPANCTAYLHSYYGNMNPATNKDPTTMNVRLWARDNGNSYERQLKHILGLDADATSHFSHGFEPPLRFTQKTDIYIDGTTVGKAADISAGFDLQLIENSKEFGKQASFTHLTD